MKLKNSTEKKLLFWILRLKKIIITALKAYKYIFHEYKKKRNYVILAIGLKQAPFLVVHATENVGNVAVFKQSWNKINKNCDFI